MEYANMVSVTAGAQSAAHLPPILVVGSSEPARRRAVAQIEAAGMRLAGAVPVDEALDRLERQAKATAIWVELDRDDGAVLDHFLDRLDIDAAAGRFAGIVVASRDLVDPVMARLVRGHVELLVEGAESERIAALSLATTLPMRAARLSDVASDNSAVRLRQLSDEVGRIAATLARLSTGPSDRSGLVTATPLIARSAEPLPELSREKLRTLIRARRLRGRYFTEELFADPAWDMLLDLLQAELAQVRVPVSSLCIAAAVPATTALRWIKTLTDLGLLVRRADPHDGRRVFVELSSDTSDSIRRYFGDVGTLAGV